MNIRKYLQSETTARLSIATMCILALLSARDVRAQRQMESLGRGVVAVRTGTSQVYVGWRLLATDPADITFDVHRLVNGTTDVKVNGSPISSTTDLVDNGANFSFSNAWYVVPIIGGVEQAPSAVFGLAAGTPPRQYIPVPLQPVIGGANAPYDIKFCWVGDFDGDGEYDFLVDRLSTTANVRQYLQAYKRDGTFLWQMDMGPNSTSTSGSSTTVYEPSSSAISVGDKDNVTVYDMDGDGRAEVLIRTANGVVFGDGAVKSGGASDNVQFLSVVDGLTGVELTSATVPNPYIVDGPLNSHAGILYGDGVHPYVFLDGENRIGTGAFRRITTAWSYQNGQLVQEWSRGVDTANIEARAHMVRIADVDHDGLDELVQIGSAVSGKTGLPLYDTEIQHGDRYHITDIDPDRPGLETYLIQQYNSTLLATALMDTETGAFLKKWYSPDAIDVGRGVSLDMDPNYRGCEMYSTQPGIFDRKGNQIFANSIWPSEAVWWDADLSRELESGANAEGTSPIIDKFDPSTGQKYRLYSIYPEGVHQAYGARAAFWGDILGDWREELVLVANFVGDEVPEIRIYTTQIPATNRIYCLMQNPSYRCQATCKGYYQASYVDYYLGTGMQDPVLPPVSDARLVWRGGVGGNTWDTGSTGNWFTNNLWVSNFTATTFAPGDTVLFDLTGSNVAAIDLVGSLSPGSVTVHSPQDYVFGGNGTLTGSMGLIKAGGGSLTLEGDHDYTGSTRVDEGMLIVNGSLSNSPVTVRGGAWLDGRLAGTGVVAGAVMIREGGGVSAGQGVDSPGSLMLEGGLTLAGRTLNDFDLSDDPSGASKTNDLIVLNGGLTLQGTNTFVIHHLDATLPTGLYPLITYSGALTGTLANLAVSGLEGVPYVLTNPPGQIVLEIRETRLPTTITWTGGLGGNAWDLLITSNWLNGASKDLFVPGDTVQFDSIGASNQTVTLSGSLEPASVLVSAATPYTFTGSGAIIGSGGLSKSGSGTLTINALNNTYTGPTTISGGTVSVPELDLAGFASPLGNGSVSSANLVLLGGALLRVTGESATDRGLTLLSGTGSIDVANGADQVTISGQIAGLGRLRKTGPGTLALAADNNHVGGTLVEEGWIALGGDVANAEAFGSGPVTFAGGSVAMYDNSGSYNSTAWDIIVNSGTTGTLLADSRVDMYGLRSGGGTLNLFIPYVRTTLHGDWSGFTGQLNLTTDSGGGDFRVANAAGFPNGRVHLAANIFMYSQAASGSTIPIGEFSAESGATVSAGSGSGAGVQNPVKWQVGGLNTDSVNAATFVGTIWLIKEGSGTWTLTGDSSYTGTTTINGGTLLINGDNTGAAGAVGVAAAGTLGGSGIVGGSVSASGIVAPGTSIGTLTINNNLAFTGTGTAFMEISKSPMTQDLLDVAGTLTYGGTLTVVNLAGTLANGDSFKIFDAASYQGAFTATNLPPLASGLAWDLSDLDVNGTLTVVPGAPSGPQTLTWQGDGSENAWDVGASANWINNSMAVSLFNQGDAVTFTDSGSNIPAIILAETVEPGAVTVDAAQDYVFAGPGSIAGTNSLVKSGAGTLSLAVPGTYTGDTTINGGTLELLNLGADLLHRWSFNGSLADTVGTQAASIINVGLNNAVLTSSNVTLTGGSKAASDYVDLGDNVLPKDGSSVTIEIWATIHSIQKWSRIFDFGASTTENLFMSWTTDTTLESDRVEWVDSAGTSTVDNSNQPYTLGVEFHVAMVIQPGAGAGGTTRVTWYRAPSSDSGLGAARGTFDTANTLAGLNDVNCWLGYSQWPDDAANASYNEVRLWNSALSMADRDLLHQAGPDAALIGTLPSGTALSLNGSDSILDIRNGQTLTVGSLEGAAGSAVMLTSGGLNAGGDNTSSTFSGVLSGGNGLTKSGTGALTLSGENAYAGPTVVTGGTLLVNGDNSAAPGPVTVSSGASLGGSGIVGGTATVASGATLSPGASIGSLTFHSGLSLNGHTTMEILHSPLTNDMIIKTGSLAYGGTLEVTNVGGPLAAGDHFRLFDATSYSGSFASVNLPTLGIGLDWNVSQLDFTGTIWVLTTNPPSLTQPLVSDGTLSFTGIGGTPGWDCHVLSTTNLLLPISSWQSVATNQFDASGSCSVTIPVDPEQPLQFYGLQVP